MCHHYVANKALAEWAHEFHVHHYDPDAVFHSDLWPLRQAPIVRLDKNGERELVAAEWGFLPFWWKPTDAKPKRTSYQRTCINARSEDVEKKPSYREAFKKRRCLMPADEFFERGYYFHLPDHQPFAFAALWERWGTGEDSVESCTLLTTAPNELVASVGHNRMPVLLTTESQYAQWLDPEITERQPLENLFPPFDPKMMLNRKAEK